MTAVSPLSETGAPRVVMAGDAAVMVLFHGGIDPGVNARAIALARAVEQAQIPGIRDIVPTYRSVAIHFDPLRTDRDGLIDRLTRESAALDATAELPGPPIRVPVCYEHEFAPDLGDVATYAQVDPADVVRLHTAQEYRVYMLGFLPGFAYMGRVDDRIAAPRLTTPRTRVAAGSVGIAGNQTGIYPASTPGGWRIIGRTPLLPFEASRPSPFLFKPGDTVRFYEIPRAAFDAWPAS